MDILAPILSLVVGLFTFVLILRAWFQYCRVNINLPVSQTLLRLTSPILDPVSKFIPTIRGINFAAIVLAIAIVAVQFLILGVDPIMSVLIGVLSVIKTFGQILFYTTFIRAIMSWVTQGNHPMDYLIAQITEPVLGTIRKVLPRTGMIDFSVMVLGFGLILINSAMYRVFGQLWAIA